MEDVMYDVVALGELLIDFTAGGTSTQGNRLFEANPGGAPCNVLAMLTKLGRRTAFVGKVGADLFGRMLRHAIEDAGIDSGGLVMDRSAHTTLAFVQNAPDGDREFSFYRDPGADELLCPEELPRELLGQTRVFHFGSLSLTREPARDATLVAVEMARAGGALVSFDPNLRQSLWPSLDAAKRQILWGCSVCDVLKVAEEELEFLTGCKDVELGADCLRAEYPNIQLLLVSRGKDGSMAFLRDLEVSVPTFLEVKTVDTTGAGDTFCGCCLDAVLLYGLEGLDETALRGMLAFANAAASLVTTKKGAIRSMPSPTQVRALIESEQRKELKHDSL
jgi:fructokinase